MHMTFPKRFIDATTVDEDGYPVYRRREDGKVITKGAHINVEWCNQSRSIKYLFKYVNKGNDRVTTSFYRSASGDAEADDIDEVSMYYDCRYISPCEAAWRSFGYNVHYRDPSVVELGFHLPDEQNVIFEYDDNLAEVAKEASVKESMFLDWFDANKEYAEARTLKYAELPTKFVWKATERVWALRKSHSVIGRIFFVPPGSGEIFYLRLLLNFGRGPTSYEEIRTVDRVLYPTFRDACYARGLLDDDKKYIDAIKEANLHLTEEELKEFTLIDIENKLKSYNKSLVDFPSMQVSDVELTSNALMTKGVNSLICDELRYDRRTLAEEHNSLLDQLTNEHKYVYDQVMDVVTKKKGGVFFLYGYSGTGKIFVWKTLASGLRSEGKIVLTVASSGIASLLLPGGRTAHSRFAIPLNPNEFSTCNIKQGSPLADLLVKTKLIIWDEAPMVHKHCIEALDRTMRDILRFTNVNSIDKLFGGKTIVFGGDFSCKLLMPTKNIRLQVGGKNARSVEIKEFADWILSIGDGRCGKSLDGVDKVEISDDILINEWDDPIVAICKATYPKMWEGTNCDFQAKDRAILAPTLQLVDKINSYIISLNPTEA
ncbi:uncharacterized protein LOC130965536 [Arachis stenosperma]|uniref:uncharacterized protein LOC130965536 n=1 Tax=Arachis stenosperma TaxID=217475 RepID=UPI0025AB80F0|nr:uncharacterized protein LOC130965536 [Arachis stenosperma]